MAIAKRVGPRGTVYWIDFGWQGRRVWERAGSDKRAAERLLTQRRREVTEGTYLPPGESRATTFGQWVGDWLDKRRNRNADNETSMVRRHVMSREWLTGKSLVELRVGDMTRLVAELRGAVSPKTGKPLSSKTVANIYGSIRTSLTDARRGELLTVDPCVLPRGTFRRRASAGEREPYTRDEVRLLVTSDAVPVRQRVWNALAFFTGMREGEVCGRTWADWDREARPLTSLHVHAQYDGQPLKTETEKGEHPRRVPVHPALERLLAWWFAEGFELVFRRAPTPEDPIVPSMDGNHYTRWAAYNAWRRGCAAAGVRNRSLHSTRHTFITLCRRGGARKEVVEKITHNATGDIVDAYTHFDWSPLCQAVVVFGCDADVDNLDGVALFMVPAQGFEPRRLYGLPRHSRESYGSSSGASRGNSRVKPSADAGCDAALSEEPPSADDPPVGIGTARLLRRGFWLTAASWFRRAA
jgi:integrase